MIDTSIVRVHQHGACITRNRRQSMGRSRGGLTSKIHALVDTNGLPVRLAVTPGEAHDNRLAGQTSVSPERRINAACRPWLRREKLRRTAARRPQYLPAFQQLARQLAKAGQLNEAIRTSGLLRKSRTLPPVAGHSMSPTGSAPSKPARNSYRPGPRETKISPHSRQ